MPPLVDWRELYASNQAVIEQARGGTSDPLPTLLRRRPASPSAPAWRAPAPLAPAADQRTIVVGGRRRPVLVHVPRDLKPGVAVPLVCMLHGCTQDAASFAAATRMNETADRHGFIAAYPQQDRGDNPQGCWNWFLPEHQRRHSGEPAWIAALVEELVATTPAWTVDRSRIFVAGLSSGGAMAAILAATHHELFAAVAVHSGLAYGAATDVRSAFAAMARGADGRIGERPARPTPSIVIHGTADQTVAPVNADRVLRQAMAANRLAAPEICDFDIRLPTTTSRGRIEGGHAYTRSRWADRHGALMHELLEIDGLGHAWSGGAAGGSYTDPRGPNASEAIWRFFADAAAPERRAPAVERPLLGP
jgi:poly(hydroxyalkanoate) depolymerase family esterase